MVKLKKIGRFICHTPPPPYRVISFQNCKMVICVLNLMKHDWSVV